MSPVRAIAHTISQKVSGGVRAVRRVKPAMFARLMAGSAMFLASKTALVWLLDSLFDIPAWLNYLIVITSITIFGWLYHTKVTFRTELSWKTLQRYIHQAVAMKIVDYVVYNLLVYRLAAGSVIAVILASGAVFLTRVIIYIVYVFEGHEEPERAPLD